MKNKEIYNKVLLRSGGKCEICGSTNMIELHHVFGRIPPEDEINCVMLCYNHHRGQEGVHHEEKYNLDLKIKAQEKYFAAGYTEQQIRKITGGRIYG